MQNSETNRGDLTPENSLARNAVRQKILENMRDHKKTSGNSGDKLQFLVTIKPTELPPEIKDPIILQNSWKKKTFNHLVIAMLTSYLLYEMFLHFDFSQWWQFIVVAFMFGVTILYLLRFFENRVILEISADGLTLDNYIFTRWGEIEYLYYKTKYDGEGDFDGVYLVKKLKVDIEHEVRIDNLPWSIEQLGEALYHCMRRYGG